MVIRNNLRIAIEFVQRLTYKPRDCKNLLNVYDAIYYQRCTVGTTMLYPTQRGHQFGTKFSAVGTLVTLFWYGLFNSCFYLYWTEEKQQFIYETKVKYYGDIFLIAVYYLCGHLYLYTFCYRFWRKDTFLGLLEDWNDTDKELSMLEVAQDYTQLATRFLIYTNIAYIITCFYMGVFVYFGSATIMSRLFFTVVLDAMTAVFIISAAIFIEGIRERFKVLNIMLENIELNERREVDMLFIPVRNRARCLDAAQVRSACCKIRACGKIYLDLCSSTSTYFEKVYGIVFMLTFFVGFVSIIFAIFNYMEAIRAGLLNTNYMLYLFWRISWSAVVSFGCVWYCQSAVQESAKTIDIAIDIKNRRMDPLVTEAVSHLCELLHSQKMAFTAGGFFKLDYKLLLDGLLSIATYVIILAQFAYHTPLGAGSKT